MFVTLFLFSLGLLSAACAYKLLSIKPYGDGELKKYERLRYAQKQWCLYSTAHDKFLSVADDSSNGLLEQMDGGDGDGDRFITIEEWVEDHPSGNIYSVRVFDSLESDESVFGTVDSWYTFYSILGDVISNRYLSYCDVVAVEVIDGSPDFTKVLTWPIFVDMLDNKVTGVL